MIDSVEVCFDRLPPKAESLRLLHLSDPHVYSDAAMNRLRLDHVSTRKLDLVLLTGDYMVRGGEVQPGFDWLDHVTNTLRPRFGFVGIFGNHDEPALRERASALPIQWLDDKPMFLPEHGIMIAGVSTELGVFNGSSPITPLIKQIGRARRRGELTQDMSLWVLAHVPSQIGLIESLGADWVLSGHTHGGQVRFPNGWCPVDLGLQGGYNAGVFRLRDVIMTVSRGMGSRWWMPRLCCSPHIPLYTLHRGPTPGKPTGALQCVDVW